MRVVTRGDVDGVMCATLLMAAGVADEMIQVHPKDVQDGKVPVSANDVVCNLPYVDGCGMWFDHHGSEDTTDRRPGSFVGRFALAPSAARLVYEYLLPQHPELRRFERLLEVVDRFDSANLTWADVTSPEPAMLLAFVVDPRTGLGYHHSFRISNREMTQMMPRLLLEHEPEAILELPDIRARIDHYRRCMMEAEQILREHTRIDDTVLVTDLRSVGEIPPGNRFLVYTLQGASQASVSVRLSRVKGGGRISIQVGHNIFNRTCTVDVGQMMAAYGGGGHPGAGTCQVDEGDADRVLSEILARLKQG